MTWDTCVAESVMRIEESRRADDRYAGGKSTYGVGRPQTRDGVGSARAKVLASLQGVAIPREQVGGHRLAA
jgi:hypothetical protein